MCPEIQISAEICTEIGCFHVRTNRFVVTTKSRRRGFVLLRFAAISVGFAVFALDDVTVTM